VFDLPPQPVQRYQVDKVVSPARCWRFNQKRRALPAGKILRLELPAAATVRWTLDDWGTTRDDPTEATPFGLHVLDLPTASAPPGTRIRFTFQWRDAERWEGADFLVLVDGETGIAAGHG
jgi:glucoamylase